MKSKRTKKQLSKKTNQNFNPKKCNKSLRLTIYPLTSSLTHQHIIKETLTHLSKHLKEIYINFNHSKMINELFPFLIYIFNVFISLQTPRSAYADCLKYMNFLQFILILNKRKEKKNSKEKYN